MSDFNDVGDFHDKFGLRSWSPQERPSEISKELQSFRVGFLIEELREILEGYGLQLTTTIEPLPNAHQNLEKIADGLIDLVYVAMGTAHLHGLPWPDLWREVQRANMSKERCALDHKFEDDDSGSCNATIIFIRDGEEEGRKRCGQPRVKHSARGSIDDVIKPAGWRPPNIRGVLDSWR